MKKVVLSLVLASSILAISCKGNEEKKMDSMEEVIEDAKLDVEQEVKTITETETELILENTTADGFVDIEIPEFSNQDVVKNLKAYSLYARDFVVAKANNADVEGVIEEGKEILKNGREMVAKLPKLDQAKYAKTIAEIQAKLTE